MPHHNFTCDAALWCFLLRVVLQSKKELSGNSLCLRCTLLEALPCCWLFLAFWDQQEELFRSFLFPLCLHLGSMSNSREQPLEQPALVRNRLIIFLQQEELAPTPDELLPSFRSKIKTEGLIREMIRVLCDQVLYLYFFPFNPLFFHELF